MCSLEQMNLVKQIKDEMAALNKENGTYEGGVTDPAVTQALQRAQEVMDAVLASCTPPSGAEQNANPAPNLKVTGNVSLPGAEVDGQKVTGVAESSDAELDRWLKIARG
jgi:hypothetical protein